LDNARQTFDAEIAHAGSTTRELKEGALARNLQDRITWPGTLCRPDYLESLSRADIYVSTAQSDSTSVSLLEAMATGLAVVVPDIPGNREWVTSAQNGILYVPGDAKSLASILQSLIASPARRKQLGVRARRTIEERGVWSHTIRRAELLFDQLANAEC
jgi:glycosyltransferase involved in cell wall biosynthesis